MKSAASYPFLLKNTIKKVHKATLAKALLWLW